MHVALEPPATIRYGDPRFAQVRGERIDPGQGPWDDTPGSLDLSFVVNRSMSVPGV